MGEATHTGDSRVSEQLIPVLYDELRKIAAHKMACEAPGQTLQPTALVHEAWLRLANGGKQQWQNRAHFFAAAAEAMRRILVERARRKQRLKRGGDWDRVEFDEVNLAAPIPDEELLELDEALKSLSEADARAAEVVSLHFFAGLTQEEVARHLDISVSTVERTWSFARAWLFREIRKQRGTAD